MSVRVSDLCNTATEPDAMDVLKRVQQYRAWIEGQWQTRVTISAGTALYRLLAIVPELHALNDKTQDA